MRKKLSRAFALVLTFIMVITTFSSDYSMIRAFADENPTSVETVSEVESTTPTAPEVTADTPSTTNNGVEDNSVTDSTNNSLWEEIPTEGGTTADGNTETSENDESSVTGETDDITETSETTVAEETIETEETAETEETEETMEVVENIIINYQATLGGYVTSESEEIDMSVKGATAVGSTAIAEEGYVFTGWFENDALVCAEAAFIPTVKNATYVAKFTALKNKKNVLSTTVNGITITATANSDLFEEGAYLVATTAIIDEVKENAIKDAVNDATPEDVETVDASTYAFDINIYNGSDVPFEPNTEAGEMVTVTFSGISMNEGQDAVVAYVPDEDEVDGAIEASDIDTFANETAVNGTEVSLEVPHLSTYVVAIVGKQLPGGILNFTNLNRTWDIDYNALPIFDELISNQFGHKNYIYDTSKYSFRTFTAVGVEVPERYEEYAYSFNKNNYSYNYMRNLMLGLKKELPKEGIKIIVQCWYQYYKYEDGNYGWDWYLYNGTQQIEYQLSTYEDSYTLTYNKGCEDSVSDMPNPREIKVDNNTEYTISKSIPKRENWIFDGWRVENSNPVIVKKAGDIIEKVNNNITLIAQWKKVITLTVKPNGGTYSNSTTDTKYSGYVNKEQPIGIAIAPKGKKIILNGNKGKIDNKESVDVYTNMTFTGWELERINGKNSGSYIANPEGAEKGGTYKFGTDSGTIVAKYSETGVDLPIPTRDGYEFLGWSEKSNGGTLVNESNYKPNISNITLYAQWKKLKKLTIDSKGGTYAGDTTQYYGKLGESLDIAAAVPNKEFKGNKITLNGNNGTIDNSPSIDKYTTQVFDGWEKTKSSKGSYKTEKKGDFVGIFTFGDGDATLEAKYREIVILPTPIRAGYSFDGWYTKATDGKFIGKGGSEYSPNRSVTLYAHWEKENTKWVTITYKSTGKTDIVDNVLKGDIYKVKKPETKDGYTFTGWEASGNTTIIGIYQAGDEFKVENNVVLTAKWTHNYKISYELQNADGETSSPLKDDDGNVIETVGSVANNTSLQTEIDKVFNKYVDSKMYDNMDDYSTYVVKENKNRFKVIFERKMFEYTINFCTRDIDGVNYTALKNNDELIIQTGSIKAGSKVTIENHCPDGFVASSITELEVNENDKVLDIIYERKTDCKYEIHYFTQNIDDDGKTAIIGEDVEGTAKYGATISASNDPIKDMEGFVGIAEKDMPKVEIVNATGVNSIDVVFNRKTCTVEFVNDAGNQVGKALTVRYGHVLTKDEIPTVPTKTLKNYTYKEPKWAPEVKEGETEVKKDITYKATYNMNIPINCYVLRAGIDGSSNSVDFSDGIAVTLNEKRFDVEKAEWIDKINYDDLIIDAPALNAFTWKKTTNDKDMAAKISDLIANGATIEWRKLILNSDGYHIDGYIVDQNYKLTVNYFYGTEAEFTPANIIDVDGFDEKVNFQTVVVPFKSKAEITNPILEGYSLPTQSTTTINSMTKNEVVNIYYNTDTKVNVRVEYYRDSVSDTNMIGDAREIYVLDSEVNDFAKASGLVVLNQEKPDATYYDGRIVTTADDYHDISEGSDFPYVIRVVYTKIPVTITPSTTPTASAPAASASVGAAVLGAIREVVAGDTSASTDPAVLGATRTADDSNMLIWLVAMAASIGVIAAYAFGKKRKEKDAE